MVTPHGYNNSVYNAHKNVGARDTWEHHLALAYSLIHFVATHRPSAPSLGPLHFLVPTHLS